jgi:hypothetical protein
LLTSRAVHVMLPVAAARKLVFISRVTAGSPAPWIVIKAIQNVTSASAMQQPPCSTPAGR